MDIALRATSLLSGIRNVKINTSNIPLKSIMKQSEMVTVDKKKSKPGKKP